MTATTTLRGWTARAESAEVSLIIFAMSASKAKTFALDSQWFEDITFLEVRVIRCREIDEHAATYGNGYLELDTPEQCRIVRDLGWWEVDGGNDICEECELYPWRLVQESKLNEDGVCRGCRDEEAAEAATA